MYICLKCKKRKCLFSKGICDYCSENKEILKVKKRRKNVFYNNINRIKKKKLGICIYCTRKAKIGCVSCQHCLDYANKYFYKHKKRQYALRKLNLKNKKLKKVKHLREVEMIMAKTGRINSPA